MKRLFRSAGVVAVVFVIPRQIEAPLLDAFGPIGSRKGRIVAALREYKHGARVGVFRALGCEAHRSVLVRFSRRELNAFAVANPHSRVGNDAGVVEFRYPYKRATGAYFGMHRQVGYERQRAHEHRPLFLQERCAQRGGLCFDDMQAGLGQRQANDFKFFWPTRFRKWHRLRF